MVLINRVNAIELRYLKQVRKTDQYLNNGIQTQSVTSVSGTESLIHLNLLLFYVGHLTQLGSSEQLLWFQSSGIQTQMTSSSGSFFLLIVLCYV